MGTDFKVYSASGIFIPHLLFIAEFAEFLEKHKSEILKCRVDQIVLKQFAEERYESTETKDSEQETKTKKRKQSIINVDFGTINENWKNIFDELLHESGLDEDISVQHQLHYDFNGRHQKMAGLFIFDPETEEIVVDKKIGGSGLYAACSFANASEFDYIADSVYPDMTGGALVPFAFSHCYIEGGEDDDDASVKTVLRVKKTILDSLQKSPSKLLNYLALFLSQHKKIANQWNKWTVGNCH